MARARDIPQVSPEDPFRLAAERATAVRSRELLDGYRAVLQGYDAQAVHDLRVASRRLRAALQTFAPCFEQDAHRRARREIRALADALAPRRDLDVQIELLEHCAQGRRGAERRALREFAGQLERERERADRELAGALSDKRLGRLRRRLDKLLDAPAGQRPAGELDPSASLADMARLVVGRRLEELCQAAPAALDERDVKAAHRMRIAAKRLRYVLEMTGFCFGAYAARAAREARALQELLGELHDRDVLLALIGDREDLERFAREQREDRRRLYRRFRRRWRTLEREGFRERLSLALTQPPGQDGA